MKPNKAQITIIIICAIIFLFVAVPNLLFGGKHDRGVLPVYPIIICVGAIGVYLKRNSKSSN